MGLAKVDVIFTLACMILSCFIFLLRCKILLHVNLSHHLLHLLQFFLIYNCGPIDSIGTICIGKDWAYGPIPNPRIGEYPRTTSKGRDKNYTLKRGK